MGAPRAPLILLGLLEAPKGDNQGVEVPGELTANSSSSGAGGATKEAGTSSSGTAATGAKGIIQVGMGVTVMEVSRVTTPTTSNINSSSSSTTASSKRMTATTMRSSGSSTECMIQTVNMEEASSSSGGRRRTRAAEAGRALPSMGEVHGVAITSRAVTEGLHACGLSVYSWILVL